MSQAQGFSLGKYRRKLLQRWNSFKRSWRGFWKFSSRISKSLFKLRDSEIAIGQNDRRRRPASLNYINPFFWILQFARLVIRYVQSRSYPHMMRGLPALSGFAFPAVLSMWLAPTLDQVLQQATSQFSHAEAAGDLPLADFHARRICAMIPDQSSAWMRLAIIRDRQGKSVEAEQLAIDKGVRRGYIPAAEWLADRRFAAVVGNPDPDPELETELVEGLKWIIARREDDVRANFMLGTYLLSRSQLLEARSVLRLVVTLPKGNFPEALYSLAVVEGQLDDQSAARSAASEAADAFLERDSLREFRVESFMQLIRSLLIARREADAIQMIQQKTQDQPAYTDKFRQLTGEVFAAWSQRLRNNAGRTPEDIQQALKAISEAVVAAPSSPMVTTELIALAGVSEISDETLDQHLQAALNAGVSPGVIHFIQGTRCIVRNPPDLEAGLQHLRIADTHHPGMPGLLNNMADAIVESQDPDLPKALGLAEQALKLLPNQPHVHDTRGKIFLRMNDPLKAISDFELALQAEDLRPSAHARLAEAYQMLGDPQQQAYHRAMYDSLMKTLQKRVERSTP